MNIDEHRWKTHEFVVVSTSKWLRSRCWQDPCGLEVELIRTLSECLTWTELFGA